MRRLKSLLAAGTFGAAVANFAPAPANAYPIDCAILLCLAGGFPASAECTAAKIEMIRRITPWPIEPPLQLWNCPMGMSASRFQEINALLLATGQAGISMPQVGPDGLTPDTRHYRDAIEIYHVRYSRTRNSGGEEVRDNTQRGHYNTSGEFRWVASSLTSAPEWLGAAIGGRRLPVRTCASFVKWSSDDGYCARYDTVGYSYQPPSRVRAVAIRTTDHEGNHHVELVRY
ncbi:hypothetical protein [Paracoccus beibuensis]|uniref:hypothetical protein n=1 Tax=Paracoccus beibuensis TaxID=547602 RepID=UPI00223EBA05|nr:hypothetical protein [Paracoccus beibuensis]